MEDKEIRRKPGRPPTGIGKPIGLRLQPETERKLDQWITQQDDPKPSRPEAIRRLIERATEPGKSCLHLRSETIQAFKKWATGQNLKARDNDDLLMYLIDREYFFHMMLDLTYNLMRDNDKKVNFRNVIVMMIFGGAILPGDVPEDIRKIIVEDS